MTAASSLASQQLQSHSSALEELTLLLRQDLDCVNDLILKKSHSSVNLISTLAKHLIASGGKRIRPLLTLASCQLFRYGGDHHINLATAVEFIHTATLLHDDVVDASALRRGKETAHTLWGNEASILVGDFLFSQAFKLMVETGSLAALETLSTAATIIAQGEVKQLMTKCDLSISLQTYEEIIMAKTAELFKAATEIGPILAERPSGEREAMASFGLNLGLLFQVTDDTLDYFGDPEIMGKSPGDDFKEGKVTLPIILTYQHVPPIEQAFLKKCFEDLSQDSEDFDRVLSLMRDKNIDRLCQSQACQYATKAQDALAPFPESPLKTCLGNLVQYCLERGE